MAEKLQTLSTSREIVKAISEERVFYAPVTRVIPQKDNHPQMIPVQVPISALGMQAIPGIITLDELDADNDRPNPTRLIGMKIPFVIIGANDGDGTLICSRKIAQQIAKTKLLPAMLAGTAFEGTIVAFTDFGCFVDVNGVSGMLRNADYSTDHSRVNERYRVGDLISVKCKSVAKDEKHRVTWEAVTKYHRTTPYECDLEAGAIVLGRVVDIKNFRESQGVFVRLKDNHELDVLCPMPEEFEIEKNVSVVTYVSSVQPGKDDYARPRIRGRILRLA